MKKIIAATLITASLFTPVSSIIAHAETEKTTVSTKQLMGYSKLTQLMRTTPTTTSAPVLLVKAGKKVKVLTKSAGWTHIKVGTKTGWIPSTTILPRKVTSSDALTLDFAWNERQDTASTSFIKDNEDNTVSVGLSIQTLPGSYRAVIRDSKGKALYGTQIDVGRQVVLPLPSKTSTYRVSLERQKNVGVEILETSTIKYAGEITKEVYTRTNTLIPGKAHDYIFYLLGTEFVDMYNKTDLEKIEAVATYMVTTKLQKVFTGVTESSLYTMPYQSIFESDKVDAYEATLLTTSLLRELGVPTRFVQGTTKFDTNYTHSWNEVYVNGKWEIVDITSLLEFDKNPITASSFTLEGKELLVKDATYYNKQLVY